MKYQSLHTEMTPQLENIGFSWFFFFSTSSISQPSFQVCICHIFLCHSLYFPSFPTLSFKNILRIVTHTLITTTWSQLSWSPAENTWRNNVLFMGSKRNYYLFASSKKSQYMFHRICTASSKTSPLHKRFNMVLHRISNPPWGPARSGHRPHQATGHTRPQVTQ